MYDHSDGCLLILLSFGGASLLTLFFLSSVMGYHAAGTHNSTLNGLGLACLGAWVFTVGVVVAEAIHDQRRRGRRR